MCLAKAWAMAWRAAWGSWAAVAPPQRAASIAPTRRTNGGNMGVTFSVWCRNTAPRGECDAIQWRAPDGGVTLAGLCARPWQWPRGGPGRRRRFGPCLAGEKRLMHLYGRYPTTLMDFPACAAPPASPLRLWARRCEAGRMQGDAAREAQGCPLARLVTACQADRHAPARSRPCAGPGLASPYHRHPRGGETRATFFYQLV